MTATAQLKRPTLRRTLRVAVLMGGLSAEREVSLTSGRACAEALENLRNPFYLQDQVSGTEVSGILGFAMLRMLQVKIDYRDGLVDFDYKPNPWQR